MASSNAMYVAAGIAGGMLLVGGILVVVFTLVRRLTRRRVAAIVAHARVIRRSGDRIVTLRFRNYRSPRMYASWRLKKNFGELVLLDDALIAASGLLLFRFGPSDLASVEVSIDSEWLHLKTGKPPGAEGELQISVRVPDATEWAGALSERGGAPSRIERVRYAPHAVKTPEFLGPWSGRIFRGTVRPAV